MRLTYDPTTNALRLSLDREPGEPSRTVDLPGYVDVGEGGRLVGVEIMPPPSLDLTTALQPWTDDPVAAEYVDLDPDSVYITLSVPEEGIDREQVRAAQATLRAELDGTQRLVALAIPRRGTGYEISYPSGNQ
ncbi:DUF2283 domain-containing protein [Sphaerobacter sp.]|uniref:DUF2283 domain-containing protein n=1 Tax=Sphaerobacter sp. TaxID=2099654 RepID=UPI001E14F1CB|nr:DUF2283 domain-containing protein [Sphaerobacter sp.]MBX5445500.1 DUF2283 domain-containing protein [Sphaerobacter sp.]